jgi:coenzyme F420-reducing hydrogenase delta subunit
MCTGRVDLAFVLRAFARGADGVFIGGCWPGECHYVTEGNYDALANMHLGKKLLALLGINTDRLRLEWVAASEGARFAEVMTDFVTQTKQAGPLGQGEGVEPVVLGRRIRAAQKLVPYLKLMERERLRAPEKSEEAYEDFYGREDVNRLFRELVAEKLAMSQILELLHEGPLSMKEIADGLQLNPSEVSRHMHSSSRQGFVRYDVDRQCFALAGEAGLQAGKAYQ